MCSSKSADKLWPLLLFPSSRLRLRLDRCMHWGHRPHPLQSCCRNVTAPALSNTSLSDVKDCVPLLWRDALVAFIRLCRPDKSVHRQARLLALKVSCGANWAFLSFARMDLLTPSFAFASEAWSWLTREEGQRDCLFILLGVRRLARRGVSDVALSCQRACSFHVTYSASYSSCCASILKKRYLTRSL